MTICLFSICLFVLFRDWQALASPPCPTSVSHLNLLIVLFLLIWAPWEVVLDVPRSWDLDDLLIEGFSCSPSSAAASTPDTHFSLAQTREHLCYKLPLQEQSERGELKSTVLSNNCPEDAHELAAFLYKLQPSQCWNAGPYGCVPTFHTLGQEKHLKHNIHLWWKVWDTGIESLKCCCWELQPCGFVRLYSYNDAHGFMPKKHRSLNYIHSTSSLQI